VIFGGIRGLNCARGSPDDRGFRVARSIAGTNLAQMRGSFHTVGRSDSVQLQEDHRCVYGSLAASASASATVDTSTFGAVWNRAVMAAAFWPPKPYLARYRSVGPARGLIGE
jgi:hypothetical protein